MTSPAAPPVADPLALATDLGARPRARGVRYSVCTLVTRPDEYREMVASFVGGGFAPPDCEYLYLDNSAANAHDAFAGYNRFLTEARGEFVVLCHQDVLLLDEGRAHLDRALASLTAHDPHWALCGNAGGIRHQDWAVRITDPHGPDQRKGVFPTRVATLDENFIVVRRAANLGLARELRGFHLYGTELCVVADLLGHTAYAVDFHLRHKSGGRVDDHFLAVRRQLIARYEGAFRPRWVTTMCTEFFASGSPLLNRLANSDSGGARRLVNAVQRLRREFNRRVLGVAPSGPPSLPRAAPGGAPGR